MKKSKQLLFQCNLYKLTFLIITILFICLTFGTNLKVSASDKGIQEIKQGKSYTKYDVTGDKIADSVKMTVKKSNKYKYDYSENMRIYVNNSVAYKITSSEVNSWTVNLIFLQNNIALFDISIIVVSDDVEMHELFQYKNGKLESVYDLQGKTALGYTNNHYIHVKKTSGNTIHCNVFTQFLTTGGFLSFDVTIKYEGGKFKIPPTSFSIKYDKPRYNKWTVNKKLKIYKKAGSKELAYILKKGDKIKINAVIYKGKKIYFQTKNSKGMVGYLPATKDSSEPYCFKETVYSG